VTVREIFIVATCYAGTTVCCRPRAAFDEIGGASHDEGTKVLELSSPRWMGRKIKIAVRILVTVTTATLVLPLVALWLFGTSLVLASGFFEFLIIMLPMGFGLFSALTLALRYEKFAYDKIPLWVWFGLAVGMAAAVWLTNFRAIPISWQHGGAYLVAKSLWQSGIGAILSVITCLCAVLWLRRNIDEELNLQVDTNSAGSSTCTLNERN
jgi:hypothetical protein